MLRSVSALDGGEMKVRYNGRDRGRRRARSLRRMTGSCRSLVKEKAMVISSVIVLQKRTAEHVVLFVSKKIQIFDTFFQKCVIDVVVDEKFPLRICQTRFLFSISRCRTECDCSDLDL